MAFDLDIGYTCEVGLRSTNEDFCAAMLPSPGQEGMGAIAAMADGVSAGGMGREAAQTTVTSLVRDYFGTPETWDTTVALDRIISAQNAWLCGINRRRSPALGLTTLTALVLRGQSYALAHVGDTRAYLLREGVLTQLSQDHVVAHPDFAHQLTRSVGAQDRIVVDYTQGDLLVGDVFALLSDGVHGHLNDRRIQVLLAEHITGGAHDASAFLVHQALAAGSVDNASALVVHVRGLLDANLHDAQRAIDALPVPPLLAVGDVIDALRVDCVLADSLVNRVYGVSCNGERYVLKCLLASRSADPQEREMLAHEAWLALRMQSGRMREHLCVLHATPPSGAPKSASYLLFDWHEGQTLEALLAEQQGVAVQKVLAMAIGAARALGLLHRQSVVHRDIKPANLHWGSDGVLRILDLGVALSGRESAAARALHAGTPSYMNPEQWGLSASGRGEPQAANLLKTGSVIYQYTIQNTDPVMIFEAVKLLRAQKTNVVLVNYHDLGDLARQKAKQQDDRKKAQMKAN